MPLDRAIESVARTTQANIVVRSSELAAAQVDVSQKVTVHLWDVSLRSALRVILGNLSENPSTVTFNSDDGVIYIATGEVHNITPRTLAYNVSDIVKAVLSTPGTNSRAGQAAADGAAVTEQEVIENLTKMIIDTVEPDSWRDNGGTLGACHTLGDVLIITQSAENQRRVAELLTTVRGAFDLNRAQ